MAAPYSGVETSAVATAARINAQFWRAYERQEDPKELEIARMFVDESGVLDSVPMRVSTIAAPRHPPHESHWPEDTDRPMSGFAYDATNFRKRRYHVTIQWRESDELFDQTQSLQAQAQNGALSFKIAPVRFLIDALTGGSDVVQDTLTALDGQGIFSADDGSGTRFGATGGNTFAGTGVTAAQIRADIFSARTRARNYRDYSPISAQPLLDPGGIDELMVIIAPHTLEAAMTEAINAPLVANAAGTAGGLSNIVQFTGGNYRLWLTSRLTGSTWYAGFPKAAVMKPLLMENVTGIQQFLQRDGSTSDNVFELARFRTGWHRWVGYGCVSPSSLIRVVN